MSDDSTQLTTKQLVALRRQAPWRIDEYFAARQRQLSEALHRISPTSSEEQRVKARLAAEEDARKTIERERKDFETLVNLSDANQQRRQELIGKLKKLPEAPPPPPPPLLEDGLADGKPADPTPVRADELTKWTIARFRSAVAEVLAHERRALGKTEKEESPLLVTEADSSWQSNLPDAENPTSPSATASAPIRVRRVWDREHPYPRLVLERQWDSLELQRNLASLHDVYAVSFCPADGVKTTAVEFALMQIRDGIRVIPEEQRQRLLEDRRSTFVLAEARGTRAFLRKIRERLESRSSSIEPIRLQVQVERTDREGRLPKPLAELINLAEQRARSEIDAAVRYSQGKFESQCEAAVRLFGHILDKRGADLIRNVKETELGANDPHYGKSYDVFTIDDDVIGRVAREALEQRIDDAVDASSQPPDAPADRSSESVFTRSDKESAFVRDYFAGKVLKNIVRGMIEPGSGSDNVALAGELARVRYGEPVPRESFEVIIAREIKALRRALNDVPQRFKVTRKLSRTFRWHERLKEFVQAIMSPFGGIIALLAFVGAGNLIRQGFQWAFATAGIFMAAVGIFAFFAFVSRTRSREHDEAVRAARSLARKEFRAAIERIKDSWSDLMQSNSASEVDGAIHQVRVFLSPMAAAAVLQAEELKATFKQREAEIDKRARALDDALKSVDAADRRIKAMADKVWKALCKKAQLEELPS